VDLVALAQQQLGQIRAILAGDSRDQCFFQGIALYALPTLNAARRLARSFRFAPLACRACAESDLAVWAIVPP
jgi:hypothetical protein